MTVTPADIDIGLPLRIGESELVGLPLLELGRIFVLELLVGEVIEAARVQLVQLGEGLLGRVDVLGGLVCALKLACPHLKQDRFYENG